jgi:hypothetical protein
MSVEYRRIQAHLGYDNIKRTDFFELKYLKNMIKVIALKFPSFL